MSETAPESTPKSNGKRLGLGCLVVAIVVIGVPAACTAVLSMGGSGSDWTPTVTEARTVCEGWVKDQLKAPATAHFVDGSSTGSAGTYSISGSVDAENSFGALIRTDWTCTIDYSATDKKWHGSADLAN
ncbi:MAG: hypothetical protein FWF90_11375 [Promicromonosporaceae bacterium]|nr:hypothetical protein [Promicromonosporaceae bacterium]